LPVQIKTRFRDNLYELEQPGDWSFIRSHKIGVWLYCLCEIVNPISGREVSIDPDGKLSVSGTIICPACLARIEVRQGEMQVVQSEEGSLYSKLMRKEAA
jgi:hypothetical protein